jgi:hypothetical protein
MIFETSNSKFVFHMRQFLTHLRHQKSDFLPQTTIKLRLIAILVRLNQNDIKSVCQLVPTKHPKTFPIPQKPQKPTDNKQGKKIVAPIKMFPQKFHNYISLRAAATSAWQFP